MTEKDVFRIKEALDGLKQELRVLRSSAEQIVEETNRDRFMPDELLSALSETIVRYREKEARLQEVGTELPLSLECASISEIDEWLAATKQQLQQSELRKVILDYFRLTTEAQEFEVALVESQKELVEKCRTSDCGAEMISPYQIVVNKTRAQTHLSLEEFDVVERTISKRIALCADRGWLRFVEDKDLSAFLDGSCEFFKPIKAPENNHNEKAAATEPADIIPNEKLTAPAEGASLSEEAKAVPAGETPDIAEKIAQEATQSDETAARSVAVKPVPEEKPYGRKDASSEECQPQPDNSVEKIEAESVQHDPGREDCLCNGFSFSFEDTPASQLGASKFISTAKQYPELLRAMFAIGSRKLYVVPEQSDDSTDSNVLSKDALRVLKKERYIAPAVFSSDNGRREFLVLTAKGWACYKKNEVRNFIKRVHPSWMIDKSSVERGSNWSVADGFRYLMLHDFYGTNPNEYGYIVVQPNRSVVSCGVLIGGKTKEFFYPVAFCEEEEQQFLDELVAELTMDEQNGLDSSVILLVRSKKAMDWLHRMLPISEEEASGIRFCVLSDCDVLYDFNGNPIAEESGMRTDKESGETSLEAPDAEKAESSSDTESLPESGESYTAEETPQAPAAEADTDVTSRSVGYISPQEAETERKTSAEMLCSSMQKGVAGIDATLDELLSTGKLYCVSAYLAAADRTQGRTKYEQFAYAVNDPMAHCAYSSQKVFDVYYALPEKPNDYYVVSAALRNFFSDRIGYDYNIQRLQTTLNGVQLLSDYPALSRIVYALADFKAQNHKGMDCFADYRRKALAAADSRIQRLKREARELYAGLIEAKPGEKASLKRFVETKKILFNKNGDIAVCLQIVAKDDRSEYEFVKAYLETELLADGAQAAPENLDDGKIDEMIFRSWADAGKNVPVKKNAALIGSLRSNLFKTIRRVAEPLCDYVRLVESNPAEANVNYQRIRRDLLANIAEALKALDNNNDPKAAVLCHTLREICDKLEGSFAEEMQRYYYIDFLKNNLVLLDENYFPILERVEHLDKLSPEMRILRHAREQDQPFPDRLREIFSGGDDFGSARLILRWYRQRGEEQIIDAYEHRLEAAAKQPLEDVDNRYKAFLADMEMAQGQGQIDNADGNYQDLILKTVDYWREILEQSQNYGFFYQILEAFREQIRQKAKIRAKDMEDSLDDYLRKNPKWSSDPTVEEAVQRIKNWIVNQNYTSAEDLLNRLQENGTEIGTAIHSEDYLCEFLAEYSININRVKNNQTSVQKQIPTQETNKDTRGAARMVASWPAGNGVTKERIENLFSALGFQIRTVTKAQNINRYVTFSVRLKSPENGRKINYKHPIYVFGSEAERDDFRVVCIFGKMTANSLIEAFKDIGSTKNTIILLDYALTLPDRQELARRSKSEYSGKTFAVIDRVVLAYLVRHYSEAEINRRLMAVIMPYSAFQPYVADSARVMPPEIFMGRKTDLDKIESPTGVNIVYGGRQLGKSALLRMAKNDINNDENGNRAVLVDIKGKDYRAAAKKISQTLSDEGFFLQETATEDWGELARAIKNRLRDEKHRIPYFLLLLDEADAFLESCAEIVYAPFDDLKDIQSIGSGRFKFVVAGLRNVVRFNRDAALSNNSVLTHLSAWTVKPFSYPEARELLEVPLSYLGFRFRDDERTECLISNICGTTNYFPGLIQLYCAKLIEAMRHGYAGYSESETPPYYVREEHIKRVLADKSLTTQIKDKFYITLKVDEDDFYYIIALLGAFLYRSSGKNSFSAADVHVVAEDYSIGKIRKCRVEQIDALMKEMCELNVLQDTHNGTYRFARYSFYQMMGTINEIEDEILKYGEAED